jgi:hypothetical protein
VPRKRRRRPRELNVEHYVASVSSWDWSYSFGLNNMKLSPDRFAEYRHLTLQGEVIGPATLKGRAFEAVLLPDAAFVEDQRDKISAHVEAVGSLSADREKLSALLSLPGDALAPILMVLAAGRLKFAVLTGERLRYRRARVRYYSLEPTMEEDDIPGGDAPPDSMANADAPQ